MILHQARGPRKKQSSFEMINRGKFKRENQLSIKRIRLLETKGRVLGIEGWANAHEHPKSLQTVLSQRLHNSQEKKREFNNISVFRLIKKIH